jgi:hypothetical protein
VRSTSLRLARQSGRCRPEAVAGETVANISAPTSNETPATTILFMSFLLVAAP